MGWLFTLGADRKRIIDELVRLQDTPRSRFQTLRYCTRGNVLWTIRKVIDKQTQQETRYIGCHLLQRSVDGKGSHKRVSWGYKSMDESDYPYYFSCPLSYLDEAPVTCPEWREHVKRYHRKFEVGERVNLIQGCSIPYVDLVSIRPFVGVYQGVRYRLKRDLIDRSKTKTDNIAA